MPLPKLIELVIKNIKKKDLNICKIKEIIIRMLN